MSLNNIKMNKVFCVTFAMCLTFAITVCQVPPQEEEQLLCTQEVKICDDGSYVSRDPSNDCRFTQCPDGSEPKDSIEDYGVDSDNVEPDTETSEEEKPKKKVWLYVLVSCVGFVILISLVGGFLAEKCLKDKTHRQETTEREQAELSSGSSSSASSYMTAPTMFDHNIVPLDIPRDVESGLKN